MNGNLASNGAAEFETPRRVIVGIGEMAFSNDPSDVMVTHALGSCVAVCVFDPAVSVAGMLHFLLPDSHINVERARVQPGVFADTGIPLLFQTAYALGLSKRRAIVKLVGGAEVAQAASTIFNTGRRNVLAAKNILWRNGVLVSGEQFGGAMARTLHFSVADGRVQVFNGRTFTEL